MMAIIGGTGLADLADLSDTRRRVVRTPYGDPSCALTFGRIGGTDIVFLARHGYGHTIAPHQINYRANIWALREVGAERIVAVATVGGIRQAFGPGQIIIPDQIIDYTHGRPSTFFEGPDAAVTHVDFTEPYDPGLRRMLLDSAACAGITVHDGGCYGCKSHYYHDYADPGPAFSFEPADSFGPCLAVRAADQVLGIPLFTLPALSGLCQSHASSRKISACCATILQSSP